MIVMEYVKSGMLTKFLDSPPPQDHLETIMPVTKKAIPVLHAENLVFGDLQTPNIFVDDWRVVFMRRANIPWAGHWQRRIKIMTFIWLKDLRRPSEQCLSGGLVIFRRTEFCSVPIKRVVKRVVLSALVFIIGYGPKVWKSWAFVSTFCRCVLVWQVQLSISRTLATAWC